MKLFLMAWLTLVGLVFSAYAQTNVTTPGLTSGQCVQANGASSIANAPCSGQNNLIQITGNTLLTDSECGSVLQSNGFETWQIATPAVPLPNCEFTFLPSLSGLYIDFSGRTALLPGYEESVTHWTIPAVAAFRTDNPSVSLVFDGTNWEQSAVSSLACFGLSPLLPNSNCTNMPEPETGTASPFSLSKTMPVGISGLTTALSEGLNYMDLIGDTSSGSMTYSSNGANNDTTLGAMLMQ